MTRHDIQPQLPRNERIYLRRAGGSPLKAIAAEFGISVPRTSRIISREAKRRRAA